MNEKIKVKLVFSVKRDEVPGWPYAGYDYDTTVKTETEKLQNAFPDWEFVVERYNSLETAKAGFADNSQYDGIIIMNYTHGNGVTNAFLDRKECGVIIDGLYCASGDSIRAHHRILLEHLPVITVLSSDYQDIIDAVSLLEVKKRIAKSTILLFKNFSPLGKKKESIIKESMGYGSTWKRLKEGREGEEKFDKIVEERFGSKIILKTREDLVDYINGVDNKKAQNIADKWISNALGVVEPSRNDIIKGAEMYLALETAKEECDADAVSIDCIIMGLTGELDSYPCMGFFQMNNDGMVAACESDVHSILTQLAMRYIAGEPGFISDPVIDTSTNQIIYAHCVASNKCFGCEGESSPYYIRSHMEDNKGASVQVLMPLGHEVTTVKFDVISNSMAIHNGKAVGNVHLAEGCRTKLAVEVQDVNILLDKWDTDRFSWHKVTMYGNYRKQFINLARLYNMKVVEEDVR